MRDRLRSVQCPSDIADQIGGWTTSGVGQGYGSGFMFLALGRMHSVLKDIRENMGRG